MIIQGTIKRIVSDKGFGFVKAETGTEYFFHRSECADFDRLTDGQRVSFEPGDGPKGPRATQVQAA